MPYPSLQATADLYFLRRHLNTHRQVWLSLCGASWCTQGSVYALQEPISQSCVSSGSSVVELMATSPKRAYTYPSLLHPEPLSCGSLLLTRTSTGDAKTQFCFSLCGDPGSWYAQGLFQPCERLWKKWGWILNANLPLLPSCWGFSFCPWTWGIISFWWDPTLSCQRLFSSEL